jgi:PAS domain S-box-containing protein
MYKISMYKQNNKLLLIFFYCFSIIGFPNCKKTQTSYWDKATNEIIRINVYNKFAFSNYDSSNNYLFTFSIKALENANKRKYSKGIAESYSNLGIYYMINNDFLRALQYNYFSIRLFDSLKSYSEVPIIYIRNGDIYKKLKQYNKASNAYLRALQLALLNKDTLNIIKCKISMGQNSTNIGDYSTALNFYYEAFMLLNKCNYPDLSPKAFKSTGDLFFSKLNFDSAVYYYHKAIETNMNYKFSYSNNTGAVYTLLAHIAQIKKNYKSALQYNRLALSWRKVHNQEEHYINSLLNIGNSFLDLKSYDSAYYYLKSGIELAKKRKLYWQLEYGYKNLYQYYLATDRWKTAFSTYLEYSTAKDSVQAEKNRNNVVLFETNRILSETEEKNHLLTKELDIKNLNIRIKKIEIWVLLVSVIISLIICIIIYRFYLAIRRSRRELLRINRHLDEEILDKKQVEKTLRESEAMYRFLAENSKDVISRTDRDLNLVYISPSCVDHYGFTQQEMMQRRNYGSFVHPEFRESLRADYQNMAASRKPAIIRYRALNRDGIAFWAESHGNPIFDETTGELREMIAIVRDITVRVEQEATLKENARQKELLIREIHHRAKNNFGILISLMNMQKEKFSDPVFLDSLTDLQTRVRTMGLLHDELYRSKNIADLSIREYLEKLADRIISAYRRPGINVQIEIEDCYINVETALPLGLILNELLTNAYKYAFGDKGSGNIRIQFHVQPGPIRGSAARWSFMVWDDGIGLPGGYDIGSNTSLGSQILLALTEQLGAELIIRNDHGACFTLSYVTS